MKKSGEPGTRPDLRVTPLREASYSRLVRALLDARRTGDPSAPGTLNPGDIALVMDGGRPGNKNKLLLPWKIGTSKEGAGKGKKEEEDGDGEGEDEAEGDDEDEEESKPGLAPTQRSPWPQGASGAGEPRPSSSWSSATSSPRLS